METRIGSKVGELEREEAGQSTATGYAVAYAAPAPGLGEFEFVGTVDRGVDTALAEHEDYSCLETVAYDLHGSRSHLWFDSSH